MALDFYYISEKDYKNPIFQIEENDLLLVEDSLVKLKKLTGINVDAYGKTRIYPDHVSLWLKLLNEFLSSKEKFKSSMLQAFGLRDFLTEIVRDHEGLMIIGD